MFKNIMVPLDGSALAERALPYAEALARASGARLVLVRAALARTFPGTDTTKAQVQVVGEAERYLASMATRLAERRVAAKTAVPYGEASQAIIEEVCLRRGDLVVMATHGRSGLGRWAYGSVAEAVLAKSPVPVLLVRAWQAADGPARLGATPRLLVPLDGSAFAEAALPVADRLARVLNGRLILVHAVAAPERVMTAEGRVVSYLAYGRELAALEREVNDRITRARDWLTKIAARLSLSGEAIQLDVRVGATTEAIAAANQEHGTTMIVMSTHGRTGLGRLLFGSVAQAVLHQTRVPLLLVRPSMLEVPPTALLPCAREEAGPGPRVSIGMSQDDLVLLRTALQTLRQTVSGREHLHQRIGRLLERLAYEEAAAVSSAANGQWTGTVQR